MPLGQLFSFPIAGLVVRFKLYVAGELAVVRWTFLFAKLESRRPECVLLGEFNEFTDRVRVEQIRLVYYVRFQLSRARLSFDFGALCGRVRVIQALLRADLNNYRLIDTLA